MSSIRDILICACRRLGAGGDTARAVCRQLLATGAAHTVTDDLCGLAARRHEAIQRFAADGSVIVACFPRAVRWLLAAAGAPLDGGAPVLNARTGAAEQILAELAEAPAGKHDEIPCQGDWMPWFPVIDYDLCTGCGQCMSFCLFDVFTKDASGRIEVARPANCKTNCPACARICPSAAIIFPKYHVSPFNGDQVRPEDIEARRRQADLPARLGDDPYAALRARNCNRSAMEAADLTAALDIPPDVLIGLDAAATRAGLCDCPDPDDPSNQDDDQIDACDCDCDCGCGRPDGASDEPRP